VRRTLGASGSAECQVGNRRFGTIPLNDSGGQRLEVMAHDGAPKQITIARKYESTKKSKPEIEHQRGHLNYEEIPRLYCCGFLGSDPPCCSNRRSKARGLFWNCAAPSSSVWAHDSPGVRRFAGVPVPLLPDKGTSPLDWNRKGMFWYADVGVYTRLCRADAHIDPNRTIYSMRQHPSSLLAFLQV
jgi:hypothetical protein